MTEADYTIYSWTVLKTALAMPEATNVQIIAKKTTINNAIAGLVFDSAAPTLDSVTPARGEITLAGDGTFIFTVDARDEGVLSELKIKHSIAAFPEFSVYANETNPYGSADNQSQFTTAGIIIAYSAVDQKWIINFGPAITSDILANGGVTFYLVMKDAVGNQFGSLSETTTENTFEYIVIKEITGFIALVDVDLDADQHLISFADLKLSGNLPTFVTVTDGSSPVNAVITDWEEDSIIKYAPIAGHTYMIKALWTMPEGYKDDISPVTIRLHVNVIAVQTDPLREVTEFTPLTTVEITTDNYIVDLVALKSNSWLPASVLVSDGVHDSVVAQITDWSGTYNGYIPGIYELTAVWSVPVGYADAVPTEITILVDVQVAQSNEITMLEIFTSLSKIYYNIGDRLNLSKLVVKVTYADLTTANVAYNDFDAYGIETFIMNNNDPDPQYTELENDSELLLNGERDISMFANGNSTGIYIYVGETPVQDISVTATSVIAGYTLDYSIIIGSFKDSLNNKVEGYFQWDSFATPPIINTSGTYAWTFWPDDKNNYIPVNGFSEVTVLP